MISELSIAEVNYDIAVELVKETFWQEDLIIEKHLTKVLKLK